MYITHRSLINPAFFVKIFFSATTYKIDELGEYYFLIRDHLIQSGNVLVHDWLSNVHQDGGTFTAPEVIESSEYKKAINAIEDADLVIFETTQPSFSTGHLMTLSLQKKVPTLVMWLDDSAWSQRRGMIENIDSNDLELSEYNKKTYKDVVNAFINKHGDSHLKHRFNLVFDDIERQYIDWLSYNTFKSRTRLIREMIREKIDNDTEYTKLLSRNRSKD